MPTTNPLGPTVLALAPCARGVGYVSYLSVLTPFDWGTISVAGPENAKNAECLRRIIAMIADHPSIEIVVLSAGSNRAKRIARLIGLVTVVAEARGIAVHHYAAAEVREVFKKFGGVTKQEIARVIADQIPAFSPKLPKPRRLWEPERTAMAMFDAAALGMTYYFKGEQPLPEE